MKFLLFIFFIVFSYTISATTSEIEEDLPLFELGAGFLTASFPDYPGSAHNKTVYIPFPSAIIRGDILRASRDEGVRGRFINSNYFELDLSFDGTVPSKGRDNPVRSGMPELDMVIEMGPSLIIRAIPKHKKKNLKINLHLPTRYIFSTDIKKTRDRGLSFNPFVSVVYNNFPAYDSLIFFTVGSKWATRKLNNYYYEVAKNYETNTRPRYHAKSGNIELSTSLFYSQPIYKNIWGFAGVIKSLLNNSSNRNSPLLVKRKTTSYSIGFYWNFILGPTVKEWRTIKDLSRKDL